MNSVSFLLDSDKSVIGSDGSRLRSDSYVDESPADDSANNSSGVFKDNDHSQPSALSSETNNNTKRQNSVCSDPPPSPNSHYKKPSDRARSKQKPRKRITTIFNSFDYVETENEEFLRQQSQVDPRSSRCVALIIWFMSFLIGLYVAVIAFSASMCIKLLVNLKFAAIYALLKDCSSPLCLALPTLVWILINMALVFVGAYLVTFHAPLAAGSGIPNVKCYLNGIQMPGLMSLKTLLAKAGGVVLSVSGGLACGKEGPMIHSGALCASSLSRVEIRCCNKSWKPKFFDPLRTDEQRRDFVAAGAASGVSAAFASPIGGVLFSLEEGASFVKQKLTWRMLFSSMTACLVLNVLLSAALGHPGNMSYPGLISFGQVGDTSFRALEIPIFIVMGIIGGLTGALFVHLNYKITLFRRRFDGRGWLKVGEAVSVAAVSALVFIILVYAIPDCKPIRGLNATAADNRSGLHNVNATTITTTTSSSSSSSSSLAVGNSTDDDVTTVMTGVDNYVHVHGRDIYGYHDGHYVIQGFCPHGQHNRMADMLFKTGEAALHEVLHAPLDEWNILPLLVVCVVYGWLATWTYGLSVSSGLFVPSLLIGALWGRVVGMLVMAVWPAAGTNIAKYALVGAAANLGGATRMTLSLTVIIIECTGDITFGVPIMLALIVAKWMGDFFNPGIYDLHIEVQGVPLLPWEPPELSYALTASDVMTSPAECLNTTETASRLRCIIDDPHSHNGYPVVEEYFPSSDDPTKCGRLKGFILKKHLADIVKDLVPEDDSSVVSLRHFMNISPYSIQQNITLPRIFKIFRGLGLRHLVVVNDRNRVVGIITRINLARYRSGMHKGFLKLEELAVLQN